MCTCAFDNVAQYQFYQEQKGELILRVVKGPFYTEADTYRVLQALRDKFRGGMDIRVVLVSEIPRTRRGKYRMLEQKLEIGQRTSQGSLEG